VLDREIVERRDFVQRDQAALSFALARLTPGTNLLAYCTAIGWLMRGLPGASVALVALPCALAAVLVKVLYERWIHKPLFAIAMHGAAAAAVGVMFATGWTIWRPLRASVPIYRLALFSGGACALAMTGVFRLRRSSLARPLLCVPRNAEYPMKVLLLYMLLLKATISTFSGLASLPVLRNELVLRRHLVTDQQLNIAIVVTRTTPGPVGVYIVSGGYFADGFAGACAGWLAMITPALIIIPLLKFAGRKAEHPRVKATIRAVVMASAGLLWAAAVPVARETATDPITIGIIVVSLAVLLNRKIESVWVIFFSGVLQIAAFSLQ
jgi:chromate transporter